MATAQDHIGYRTYGFRDLFADLLTGFSSPSDDGYAVAIVVGSRTWRVRTVFSTRESARSVGSNAPGFSDSSAAFTHDASDPSLMPSDRATSTRDRSELRNSATASRRNSSGYFDGRPTRASFLQSDALQNLVSNKAGSTPHSPTTSSSYLSPTERWSLTAKTTLVGQVGKPQDCAVLTIASEDSSPGLCHIVHRRGKYELIDLGILGGLRLRNRSISASTEPKGVHL